MQHQPIRVTSVSGFPEWMPGVRMVEQQLIDDVRSQFELYGFAPIETPAVERMAVLAAKGGVQRQIFTVGRAENDEGESDIGLHFDLTVPLARYVAQRANDLTFPFRRYQIQKVWRGERAQRGRFREFYQCDIDVVGSSSLDLSHDAEIPVVINSVFEAIGVPDFSVRVSNRKVLGAVLATEDLPDERTLEALRIIDKHGSSNLTYIRQDLQIAGFSPRLVAHVCELVAAPDLAAARKTLEKAEAASDGLDELVTVLNGAYRLGMPEARLQVDFSIARGLDYYTGTIYETFVKGNEQWGSVCSGGRYDDLATYFSRRRFPGVGVSIGLSRLLDLLIQNQYLEVTRQTPTRVLVTTQDRGQYMNEYLEIARKLRAAGVPTEIYLEPRALRDQLAYAVEKGIDYALIAGKQEFVDDTVTVRSLSTRSQTTIPSGELLLHIASQ